MTLTNNYSEKYIRLGLKIAYYRKLNEMTQEQFAEAIGIATRTLCGIETGKNFLTADTLERIITTLDITPEELFAISPNRPAEELKSEMVEIIRNLKNREVIETLYKVTKSIVQG